ncbi:MAG: serine/threonine protein kinase [Planctomycetia bacterium]|nr:serine/threonine protein kinase [Planctomycetia bacterium]
MASHITNSADLTIKRGGQTSPAPAPEETQDVTSAAPRAIGSGRVPASGAVRTANAQRSGRVPNPNAPALGASTPSVPGYVVKGEIARGGMGVVLAGRDVVLNREVAIKTLLPGTGINPVAVRRFVSEARITARLPHPGIPPVHALGTLPDGRPFLTMKLIKGRTLSAILSGRSRQSSDRESDLEITAPHTPGLLQIFEQVCQAVGFAHSQNVIHRDLKPANIMVGAFGEVQVMDWGLARVIGSRAPDEEVNQSFVETETFWGMETSALKRDNTELSQAGEALGTPAYMPKEQALGEWNKVDARADVFALGGLLCVILTGQPPYVGASVMEVVRRAGTADLRETIERLDRADADAELIDLCKRCLAPNPADRPPDAGAVAALIEVYRLKLEDRLKMAETARLASLATAEHVRHRAEAERAAKLEAEARAERSARRAVKEAAKAAIERRRNRRQLIIALAAVILIPLLYGEFRAYMIRREWNQPIPTQSLQSPPTPEAQKTPPPRNTKSPKSR